MCCICPRRKIIFIHIPKTGGLTIEKILIDYYGFRLFTFKHGPYEFLHFSRNRLGFLNYIMTQSEESKQYNLSEFFIFAFVRNPYERSISSINYLYQRSITLNIPFPNSMDQFITVSRTNPYFYCHFNLSQTDCLRNLKGEVQVNFIGRFENFKEDLSRLLFEVLGLPVKDIFGIHENKNSSQLIFNKSYIRDTVTTVHAEDFRMFGYLIDSNKNEPDDERV